MHAEGSPQKISEDSGKRVLALDPFSQTLSRHGLKIVRAETNTLQINMGFLCNQVCRHCHLSAGPTRRENMDSETAAQVVDYAKRGAFGMVDITGGAPELNLNLTFLIESLAPIIRRLMIRCNLTASSDGKRDHLFGLFKEHQVVIIASFPSLNQGQTESQRGHGIFNRSLRALRLLNTLGYGQEGSGLELNLVSNPTGAFLPPAQAQAEKRFRQVIKKQQGIVFNHLFTFANAPLGRFRDWLIGSGNFENYIQKLAKSFNPCAVDGVMCRDMVSVSWNGYLYDCDFNLAKGLPLGGRKTHISQMPGPPQPGDPIAVADHCYACTAGAGFT